MDWLRTPQKLFHITSRVNLESIDDHGLGAIAGEGVDGLEHAQQGIVYFFDFDPIDFLSGEGYNNLNHEQMETLLAFIGALMYNKTSIQIAVLEAKINQEMRNNLQRHSDPYVWVYQGVVEEFHIDCFEISKNCNNQYEFLADEIYSMRIEYDNGDSESSEDEGHSYQGDEQVRFNQENLEESGTEDEGDEDEDEDQHSDQHRYMQQKNNIYYR